MIKAISTSAYGCYFRSRLEARFAVFFTKTGWEWQYEPEGYQLPSGFYLPDFWVKMPDGDRFVEVKQFDPTDLERTKAQELANCSGHNVTILTHQYLAFLATHGDKAAIAALSQRFEFGAEPR